MTVALPLLLAAAVSGPLAAPPAPRLVRVYAGVACRQANTVGCDRIGLAVELRPRPRAVVAWVDGRPITLRPLAGGSAHVGHLPHAGVRETLLAAGVVPRGSRGVWAGGGALPWIRALVVVTDAAGDDVALPLVTALHPGWG